VDNAERTGLGLSVAGHVALFAMLSLGLFAATKPIVPTVTPIDIQIVDKVGLTDTVPNPSPTPPAARVAPEVGPPEEAAPEPTPAPVPAPAPTPKPEPVAPPKPVVKPTPAKPAPSKPAPAKPVAVKPAPAKPTPADAQPRRRPGLSRSLIAGLTDTPGVSSAKPNKSTSTTPRAAAGPAVEASLGREVLRQLKPFWHSPTGADAEQLRTQLSISLARDGSVVAVRALGTTGVTDSNRGQVKLHQEAAIKAVRLAAPFSLPAEFFESWKLLEPVSFDRKLSQ
jgi:outer membrane biosynthesis protein TonB